MNMCIYEYVNIYVNNYMWKICKWTGIYMKIYVYMCIIYVHIYVYKCKTM
jgi:hypothetical protein